MALQAKHFYEFGPFRLDVDERVITREGSPLALTPKAFDTLLALVENSKRIMEKEQLMKLVWPDSFVEEANLAVNISSIRKVLGEPPTGGQFIETIPRRGYRFNAEVREVKETPIGLKPDGPASGADETMDGHLASHQDPVRSPTYVSVQNATMEERSPVLIRQPEGVRSTAVARQKWLIGLAALVLVVSAVVYFFMERDDAPHQVPPPRSLAVLPFRNQKPDVETDFLGPSLADAITTKLGYVSAVSATIVRPASYVGGYDNQTIAPKKFAKELNVDTLLTGSYVKEGDDLRITVELIDVRKDLTLWNKEINLKYDRLLTVQDQVSQQVISGLQVNLSAVETELFNRDAPTSPDAYEKFLHGVDLYQTNRFATAIQELQRSVELSPKWALAWAHLGRAHSANAAFHLSGKLDYDKALECYKRALELNPQQNEAHIFMANFFTDTGRVSEAVPLLREVLRTNSNLAEAHWELGYAYRFGGMIAQSIAECELARRLNPAVKLYSSALTAYLYNGEYQKFVQSLPQTEIAYIVFYRGLASYYQKDPVQTASYFDRAYELDKNFYTRIGKAISYAIRRETRAPLELLLDTRQMIDERSVGDAEGIYKVAQAYAALGDKASALHVLQHTIDEGFFCYPYFESDPLMESLRGEPEWRTLMELARAKHEEFKRRFF